MMLLEMAGWRAGRSGLVRRSMTMVFAVLIVLGAARAESASADEAGRVYAREPVEIDGRGIVVVTVLEGLREEEPAREVAAGWLRRVVRFLHRDEGRELLERWLPERGRGEIELYLWGRVLRGVEGDGQDGGGGSRWIVVRLSIYYKSPPGSDCREAWSEGLEYAIVDGAIWECRMAIAVSAGTQVERVLMASGEELMKAGVEGACPVAGREKSGPLEVLAEEGESGAGWKSDLVGFFPARGDFVVVRHFVDGFELDPGPVTEFVERRLEESGLAVVDDEGLAEFEVSWAVRGYPVMRAVEEGGEVKFTRRPMELIEVVVRGLHPLVGCDDPVVEEYARKVQSWWSTFLWWRLVVVRGAVTEQYLGELVQEVVPDFSEIVMEPEMMKQEYPRM